MTSSLLQPHVVLKKIAGQTVEPRRALLRRLGSADLADVLELQELVMARLPDRSLYYGADEVFMRDHLDERGQVFGVFDGEKLVAVSVILFPHLDPKEENLGLDIDPPLLGGLYLRLPISIFKSFIPIIAAMACSDFCFSTISGKFTNSATR